MSQTLIPPPTHPHHPHPWVATPRTGVQDPHPDGWNGKNSMCLGHRMHISQFKEEEARPNDVKHKELMLANTLGGCGEGQGRGEGGCTGGAPLVGRQCGHAVCQPSRECRGARDGPSAAPAAWPRTSPPPPGRPAHPTSTHPRTRTHAHRADG